MPFRIYNTLSRRKEIFRPAKGKTVRFYSCGPTVWDYVHIGNLRTSIFNDLLRRTLLLSGWGVKQIMNITDVDDKTIRGAKNSGKNLKEYAQYYEKAFLNDIKNLNILPASKYVRATDEIKKMVEIILILLKKGIAYKTEDGVYFSIAKFPRYGRLARLAKQKLKAGARVSSDEYEKKSARDFALWKFKKIGEPFWTSPFGKGRPGWHIECSAMAIKYLGLPIDIHSGGVDLIFPHHENEIAQSEAAFGKKFVKFFAEGEHLMVEGRKMSKSLGNLYTLRDLAAKGFDPLDFRYLCLTAHYRSPLSFTWESLSAARQARLNLENKVREAGETSAESFAQFKINFMEVAQNDLNVPKALALVWKSSGKEEILFADKIFGLGIAKVKKISVPSEIKNLLKKREELRSQKKWREADEVRDKILKAGFVIKDTPEGPIVEKS